MLSLFAHKYHKASWGFFCDFQLEFLYISPGLLDEEFHEFGYSLDNEGDVNQWRYQAPKEFLPEKPPEFCGFCNLSTEWMSMQGLRISVAAKARAQKVADGIQSLVIDQLLKLL